MPNRPTTSRSRPGSTSQSILQAAAEAFLSVGFRETNLDQVATAAGVTKPTIYSHFGSKQGLLLALVESHVSANADALSTSLETSGQTETDLRRFGELFLARVMSKEAAQWRRLALEESLEHPEIGKSIFNAGPARVLKVIAAFLEGETHAGRLHCEDPVLAAEQFVGLLLGVQPIREITGLPKSSKSKQTERCRAAVRTFLAAYQTGDCGGGGS